MKTAQTEQVTLLRIIDGDTVEVQRRGGFLSTGPKQRIRLYGIDAPESSQKGGDDATKHLGKIIGARTKIWLEAVATDQYGRTVGVISNKRGDRRKSYNYEMVRGGHAHCYMVDPADREAYTEAETHAKNKRKGLWRARNIQAPRDFRVREERDQKRNAKFKLYLFAATGVAVAIVLYLFRSDHVPG